MRVTVNEQPRDVSDEATVADVVASTTSADSGPAGVAVALNGDIVRRGEWEATRLRETDRVEVVTATAGG